MRPWPHLLVVSFATVAATYLVAIGEFASTAARVPPDPPACNEATVALQEACGDRERRASAIRSARISELAESYSTTGYVAVVSIALLLAVASAFQIRRADRRSFFATVGAAGVVLLVVNTGLWWAAGLSPIQDTITSNLLLPPALLLAIATAGGLAERGSRGRSPARVAAHERSAGDPAATSAAGPSIGGLLRYGTPVLSFTLVAAAAFVVFLVTWSSSQPACGDYLEEGMSQAPVTIAYFATVLGGLLLAITARRWVISLALIVLPTALYFFAGLGVGLRCG